MQDNTEFETETLIELMANYIVTHEHFNHASLAKQIGMRAQHFHEWLNPEKPRKLPKSKVHLLEEILKEYGFLS